MQATKVDGGVEVKTLRRIKIRKLFRFCNINIYVNGKIAEINFVKASKHGDINDTHLNNIFHSMNRESETRQKT
jgi:hypothetical protein